MNRKEKKKKKLGSMLCILRYIHMYRLKNIFTTQYTDALEFMQPMFKGESNITEAIRKPTLSRIKRLFDYNPWKQFIILHWPFTSLAETS